MTLNDNLRQLAQGLGTLGAAIYHYHRPAMEFPCIVWAEEGTDALHADGSVAEQSPRGTLDYFTPDEFDPMCDAIQEKLQELGLAWDLNSVQYEADTDLIHWEWTWAV